jgi:hypothetical protein
VRIAGGTKCKAPSWTGSRRSTLALHLTLDSIRGLVLCLACSVGSVAEKEQLQGWAAEYQQQIQDILSRLPKPMILL